MKLKMSLREALDETIHATLTPEKRLRAAEILRQCNSNESIRLAQLLEAEAERERTLLQVSKQEASRDRSWRNQYETKTPK